MAEDTLDNDIGTNLSNSKTWMRLVFMVLYGIVFEIGKFVGLLVALVQFISTLFSGSPQPQLQRFGYSLGEFYRQILEFETFRSEVRPYPFSPWPQPAESTPLPDPLPSAAGAGPRTGENRSAPAAPQAATKRKTTRKRTKRAEKVNHTDENAPSA